jgi:hypothetical protein
MSFTESILNIEDTEYEKRKNICRIACYMLHAVSRLSYFLTLKMEATCSSETSVDFSTDYTVLYPRRH